MDDVTTALETVRDALDTAGCSNPHCYTHNHIRIALDALSTIEAELARLRVLGEHPAWEYTRRLEAERDEAVAALRRIKTGGFHLRWTGSDCAGEADSALTAPPKGGGAEQTTP